eukprot:403364728
MNTSEQQSTDLANSTSRSPNNRNKDNLLKPVGPGEYKLPNLTGVKQVVSTKQNQPSFSMRERTDTNSKMVISSDHKVDQIGKDSPGVGQYSYDYSKLTKSVLSTNNKSSGGGHNYSFSGQRKYFDFTSNMKQKAELPHFYDLSAKAKWLKNDGGFPKDQRFKYDLIDRKLAEQSPGPITAKLPNITPKNQPSNFTQFDDGKKIFFKELEHDVQGKDSPGFVYEQSKPFAMAHLRKNSFTFGRQDRRLNENKKALYVPSPGQYDTIQAVHLVKLKPTGGGFSKATRNVDLVNYSERHGIYGGQKMII